MSTLQRAIEIAVQAHQGQKEKTGTPYILHPLRVMMSLSSEAEMIAAVLHDVVERSPWTFDELRQEGFSEEILGALDCVTRRENETYEEFVGRNKRNPLGRRVRTADLEDKLDLRRVTDLREEHLQRLQRFHRAWRILSGD